MKPYLFHAPADVRPRDALMRALGIKGRRVGSGAYATVFKSSKNMRHVVKVGELNDPYLSYLRYVLSSKKPSTIFPKIIDVVYCVESGYDPKLAIEDGEGSYAVVMERLYNTHSDKKHQLRELICGIVDNSGHGNYELELRDALKTVARLQLTAQDIKEMFKLCDKLEDIADRDGHELDFHEGNIMFRRNGELVVIDPFM